MARTAIPPFTSGSSAVPAEPLLAQFRRYGRVLFDLGLVDSHSGNLSIRWGESLCITRTGARIGDLGPGDLVFLPLVGESPSVRRASRELIVHRAIYLSDPRIFAVAHAHPPSAVALSFETDWILPRDSEGKGFLRKVPVIAPDPPSASPQLAEAVVKALKETPIVVVRGHGAFSRGGSLEEAIFYLGSLENSARLLLIKNRI